jgi:hypothetical protein
MDLCQDCGGPADGVLKRDGRLIPICHSCIITQRHERLWQELANGVRCADCGTTRATRWYKIIQGQWHCESCRGNRRFVAIVGNWRPFGEPGDGTLFTEAL